MTVALIILILFGLIAVLTVIIAKAASQTPQRPNRQQATRVAQQPERTASETNYRHPEYVYTKKPRIVTNHELLFYHVLVRALEDRFVIIPQAHLSTFLEHKIYNQHWKIALTKINKKSVDFLVCQRETLKPLFAIELDDSTHNRPDRIERDMFVNEVFHTAKMPLIRFRNGEWGTCEQVKKKLYTSLTSK